MAKSKQIKRVEDWHDSLIEFLMLNPTVVQRDIARHFNVSYSWMSMVLNSDLFKERLAERRERHATLVSRTVIDRVQSVAEQSLDELSRRLDEDPEKLPTGEVRETASLALKSLGIGVPSAAGTQINAGQVNVVTIDSDVLARARNKMKEVNADVVEAEHTVLPAPAPSTAGG